MAYKSYVKETFDGVKNIFTLNIAVIEILNKKKSLTQPEIQKIISKKPYKDKIRTTKGDKAEPLSRMGLWKILDRLEKKGEIESKFIAGIKFYNVLKKSKLLAQFNGIQFGNMFQYGLFKRHQELVKEFESSKNKKTKLDALLQFFGFFIIGSLLVSRIYSKDLRTDWLRPVLDLEKNGSMSKFFEGITYEDKLVYMIRELSKKYPENIWTLGEALKGSVKMKELTELKGKGLEKMFKVFVDHYNEN